MESNIYRNVKSIARSKKIPIYKLEEQVNVSRGNMCHWKEHEPSAITLKRVSEILDVTVDELLVDC